MSSWSLRADANLKDDGVFDIPPRWFAGDSKLELVFELALPDNQDLLTGTLDRGYGAAAVVGGVGSQVASTYSTWLNIFAGGAVAGILGTLLLRKKPLLHTSERHSRNV